MRGDKLFVKGYTSAKQINRTKKMKKYFVIFALIAVSIFGWGFWSKSAGVVVMRPVIGSAVQAVYATGTVEPTVMMPIAPRSAARLLELKADEGNSVSKGQLLAQLEDDELQHSIKQARAKEDFAHKEYERYATLQKKSVISKQQYDQAKSNLQAAIENTQMIEAQADYLKLIAPNDGLIIKRDGEVGQMIPANTPVFWLSCCAPLRISAEVDEEDISLVKVGQKVLIRSDAFAGKTFSGKVQAITPKGDPVARSYRVRIEFNEETPLQIGMTAETNIIISEKSDALLVPKSAVSGNKIWVVKDGTLSKKQVEIGAKAEKQTEIINGVTAEDLVVIKPDANLKEGDSVRTKTTEQEKP